MTAGGHDRAGPSGSDGAGPPRSDGAGPPGSDDGSRVTLPDTTRLPRGGSGPLVVVALVAVAFIVGLVRPWDWLATDTAPGNLAGDPGLRTPAAPSGGPAGITVPGADTPPPAAPVQEPTCAYPRSWRVATVQDWAGRAAHVWTAATAVQAAGPDDPAIAFLPVVSTSVIAIGWCAPVDGPERPPLAAIGTLFRVLDDGTVREVAHDRLEPAARDALGELWLPVPQSVGRRPAWPSGRYVIRLSAPSGDYERYLGIEVVTVPPLTVPPATVAPSLAPEPGAEPSRAAAAPSGTPASPTGLPAPSP